MQQIHRVIQDILIDCRTEQLPYSFGTINPEVLQAIYSMVQEMRAQGMHQSVISESVVSDISRALAGVHYSQLICFNQIYSTNQTIGSL